MNWIDLAQDRSRWRAPVNAECGISLLAENQLASQEGLCSMEKVSKTLT